MNIPPTYDDLAHLAARYARGDATPADLAAALDVDQWFAGCSTDELNQQRVETVVRTAMQLVVRDWLKRALAMHDDELWDLAMGARAQVDADLAISPGRTYDIRARAVIGLLDELREMNKDLQP